MLLHTHTEVWNAAANDFSVQTEPSGDLEISWPNAGLASVPNWSNNVVDTSFRIMPIRLTDFLAPEIKIHTHIILVNAENFEGRLLW